MAHAHRSGMHNNSNDPLYTKTASTSRDACNTGMSAAARKAATNGTPSKARTPVKAGLLATPGPPVQQESQESQKANNDMKANISRDASNIKDFVNNNDENDRKN
jgi:hypothetical protein